jgi:hypothetical protein
MFDVDCGLPPAEHRDHVCPYDFVLDRTHDGRLQADRRCFTVRRVQRSGAARSG